MILVESPSALGNHAVLVHKAFCLGLSLEVKLRGYVDWSRNGVGAQAA